MIKRLPYSIQRFINGIRYSLTQDDKLLIYITSYKKLAEWYSELNSWGWPQELLPKDSDHYVPNGRRHQLMRLIENKIGLKYILRNHNHKMTEEEFEDFWQGNHCHDKEAFERYWTRTKERLEIK